MMLPCDKANKIIVRVLQTSFLGMLISSDSHLGKLKFYDSYDE